MGNWMIPVSPQTGLACPVHQPSSASSKKKLCLVLKDWKSYQNLGPVIIWFTIYIFLYYIYIYTQYIHTYKHVSMASLKKFIDITYMYCEIIYIYISCPNSTSNHSLPKIIWTIRYLFFNSFHLQKPLSLCTSVLPGPCTSICCTRSWTIKKAARKEKTAITVEL